MMNFIYKFIIKGYKDDYWAMNGIFCWYFRSSGRIYRLLTNKKRVHPVFGKFTIERGDSVTSTDVIIRFKCGWISIFSSNGFMNSSECKIIKVGHKKVYEFDYNGYTHRTYKKGFMSMIGNRIINKALASAPCRSEDMKRILEIRKSALALEKNC